LSHEDAITLTADDVFLQEVVQDHSGLVIGHISDLLLGGSQLELDHLQPCQLGADHVLLLEL